MRLPHSPGESAGTADPPGTPVWTELSVLRSGQSNTRFLPFRPRANHCQSSESCFAPFLTFLTIERKRSGCNVLQCDSPTSIIEPALLRKAFSTTMAGTGHQSTPHPPTRMSCGQGTAQIQMTRCPAGALASGCQPEPSSCTLGADDETRRRRCSPIEREQRRHCRWSSELVQQRSGSGLSAVPCA
jgi:hypothetical protein